MKCDSVPCKCLLLTLGEKILPDLDLNPGFLLYRQITGLRSKFKLQVITYLSYYTHPRLVVIWVLYLPMISNR